MNPITKLKEWFQRRRDMRAIISKLPPWPTPNPFKLSLLPEKPLFTVPPELKPLIGVCGVCGGTGREWRSSLHGGGYIRCRTCRKSPSKDASQESTHTYRPPEPVEAAPSADKSNDTNTDSVLHTCPNCKGHGGWGGMNIPFIECERCGGCGRIAETLHQ